MGRRCSGSQVGERNLLFGVVPDKNLDGESGLDLLPRLRALIPATPVILITAFGDERTREEAFTRRTSDVLAKPFEKE